MAILDYIIKQLYHSLSSYMADSRLGPTTSSSISSYTTRAHGIIVKYKTFSVLIYSYINTSGNWENEKLCGNTTPEGRSVFTQFRVIPISTSVDITVYQYGKKCFIFVL